MTKKILAFILVTFTSNLIVAEEIATHSIGLNFGLSNSDYSYNDSTKTIDKPESLFKFVELYTTIKGLISNKKIKPYLSLVYSENDDLKHQYFLVGANRFFKVSNFDLYLGGIVGCGQLSWKYDPINNSTDNDYNANSLMAGLQVGIQYPIKSNLSLNLNGKYLAHSYTTHLETSESFNSTFDHKYTAGLSLGIEYKFGSK